MILKARFVAPVDQPVIENGAVVTRDGIIVDVGPARDLADRTAVDFGDAVICPGFVNAHTHLELTHLADRVPPTPDFIDWLRRLYAEAIAAPPTREAVEQSMSEGIKQSLAAGVTTVGDITRHPQWTRPVLAKSTLGGVSFGEVIAIGTRRTKLAERLEAAASRECETDRLHVGISPHAPYTVEPDGLRECVRTASNCGTNKQQVGAEHPPYRICIHAAETTAEAEFTHSRSGPFADYLRELNLWDDEIPISGCTPIELLHRTGLLKPTTVIAHANYMSDGDIALMARSGASVAYCPRTHHAFGHPPHRFRDMLAAGINVSIGTDSLASNPSLSVLDELRFLHQRLPDLQPNVLLQLGSICGARALGLASKTGTITPGKWANIVAIPLDDRRDMAWSDFLLHSEAHPLVNFSNKH